VSADAQATQRVIRCVPPYGGSLPRIVLDKAAPAKENLTLGSAAKKAHGAQRRVKHLGEGFEWNGTKQRGMAGSMPQSGRRQTMAGMLLLFVSPR
jgi:hypothetical protein